jgi:hypothetical protein
MMFVPTQVLCLDKFPTSTLGKPLEEGEIRNGDRSTWKWNDGYLPRYHVRGSFPIW